MGSVFEAEDLASGRHVAVKLVAPEYLDSPDAVARFRREGRLASTIAHPRCVFVLAADEDAGRPYIVMELMPGTTLKDLVDERGPLPVEEAVRKILDVVEGLQEAHRLGVIHRDVKPGNCFLEADGRVKVGDFGLAKPLAGDIHQLTRTGAFLGTLLFSSPEQIRRDPLTEQTDVYSVAATLFYLLTGKAPFQGGDAAATAARIAADPAPSLRALRPEIPAALNKVVRRGLERQRERRWRNLAEFRQALLRFVPQPLSFAGMGLRLAAYLIDALLCLGATLGIAAIWETSRLPFVTPSWDERIKGWVEFVGLLTLIFYPYLVIVEGIWGFSVGKWLLRLRVYGAANTQPPGVARALLRVMILFCLTDLWVTGPLKYTLPWGPPFEDIEPMYILGCGVLLATMRARSGYRGPHEWLSGTRVVRLPKPEGLHRWVVHPAKYVAPALPTPTSLPDHLGSFQVVAAVRWTEASRVLVGCDANLGRFVWLWQRPLAAEPINPVRHGLDRVTRLRWLAGAKEAEWQWDAFLAPTGRPLPELIKDGRRLAWSELRIILEELAQELEAAYHEGTLPATLTVDQVWVRPNGRALLLDMPWRDRSDLTLESVPGRDQERALRLLQQVATLTLEGKPRPTEKSSGPIRAPLPLYAFQLVNRLLGTKADYDTVESFRKDLVEVRDRPNRVTRLQRLEHIALWTVSLLWVLAMLSKAVQFYFPTPTIPKGPDFIGAFWLIIPAVLWAIVTRGGLSLPLMRMALVQSNGCKASRLQCAGQALLFWAPVPLVLLIGGSFPLDPYLLLLPLLVAYLIAALLNPGRSLHHRLAGTYLVPR
jgi:hypothetical protein